MEDGPDITLPALVSREPADTDTGAWRLTIFDKTKTKGIIHTNFDLDGTPTIEKVQALFGHDGDLDGFILDDFNDYQGGTAVAIELIPDSI